MAERSAPTVLAFVETSCTFPDTTARTDTDGVPTASIAAAWPSGGAAFPNSPPPGCSTTQTPTPWGPTAAVNASAGIPGGWLTMTVMPSARAVPGGGCTCNPSVSGTPSDRRRSPTFDEVVRTDCGVPATTSVTFLCHASESAVPTSSVPVARTATWSARWMRSRLSREGRTTLPPIARGGPLGEAARWKTPGPGGSLRSHECPTLPNPQPSLQP